MVSAIFHVGKYSPWLYIPTWAAISVQMEGGKLAAVSCKLAWFLKKRLHVIQQKAGGLNPWEVVDHKEFSQREFVEYEEVRSSIILTELGDLESPKKIAKSVGKTVAVNKGGPCFKEDVFKTSLNVSQTSNFQQGVENPNVAPLQCLSTRAWRCPKNFGAISNGCSTFYNLPRPHYFSGVLNPRAFCTEFMLKTCWNLPSC